MKAYLREWEVNKVDKKIIAVVECGNKIFRGTKPFTGEKPTIKETSDLLNELNKRCDELIKDQVSVSERH